MTERNENFPELRTEGQDVPNVTFRVRENGDWKDLNSDDVFKGKTVILFALPGAFTPTCSSTHLPGYMIKSDELKSNGVDDIYCLSVNDSFVMNAWAKDQGVDDEVKMLPDGNGEFTEKMGLLVDKAGLGFGKRSWRYSALVVDGKIEKLFIEPVEPGDPFKVSDAETMLGYVKEHRKQAA